MEAMMSCRFNYIIPRAGLTLTEIGRIFETDWAQECAVEITQTYYAGRLDTRQRDAHVRAYRGWRKEQRRQQQRQKRALETALWRQEQASIREQEEAWNALLEQRRQERRNQERFDHHQKEIEQQEKTLLEVLNQFSSDEPVRQALFDTRSNQMSIVAGFQSLDIEAQPTSLVGKGTKVPRRGSRPNGRTGGHESKHTKGCVSASTGRDGTQGVPKPKELPVVTRK